MGAVLALPALGSLTGLFGTLLSTCVAGFAFACTSKAAAAFCKNCNCQSSVATRVGFSLIFLLNSILAWLLLTPFAMHRLAKWAPEYNQMACAGDKCHGILAVHRVCFALSIFHALLAFMLVGVKDTRQKRAAIQNGWWGPKVLLWLVLVAVSFAIPNGFFAQFWGRFVALIGATIFILIGLVLLVDFAHSWSEKCLEKWEASYETGSNLWQWILIGSTLSMYAITIALTVVDFVFFAKSGCGLNQALLSVNLVACVLITALCILPAVQEANPRSGLAQSGMVVVYSTYLITSAVANREDKTGKCNPLSAKADAARTSMVVAGALFTFLAIAYSTSRAATQSKALVGKNQRKSGGGAIQLPGSDEPPASLSTSTQPGKQQSMRVQALQAAVEAGVLPASALDEDDDEDIGAPGADEQDDERQGTRYSYAWFHIIFLMAAMYVAMLLSDWTVVVNTTEDDIPDTVHGDGQPVRIGRSGIAMWMRAIAAFTAQALYAWSLVAPMLFPDRFD